MLLLSGGRGHRFFGAGLVAGLLGQIGEVLNSDTLSRVAEISSWVLPFAALYQDALEAIPADTTGFTEFALELGPFGGAQGAGLPVAVDGRLPRPRRRRRLRGVRAEGSLTGTEVSSTVRV